MSSLKKTIDNINQQFGSNFSTIGEIIGLSAGAAAPYFHKGFNKLDPYSQIGTSSMTSLGAGYIGNWIDKKTGLTKHLAPKMFLRDKYEDLIREYFKIKNTELPQAEIREQTPRINMLRNRLVQLQQQISIVKNQIGAMK